MGYPDQSTINSFNVCAKESFAFLEKLYGYHLDKEIVEDAGDYRDAIACIYFLGSTLGVKIYWYFSSSLIDVKFIELDKHGRIPSLVKGREGTYLDQMGDDIPRGIHLSDLVTVLGHQDDPSFLLKELRNVKPSMCKKRAKIIEENVIGVVQGLAQATQTYASEILQGDTSLFPQVIRYVTQVSPAF
jgi:hypothetical protein